MIQFCTGWYWNKFSRTWLILNFCRLSPSTRGETLKGDGGFENEEFSTLLYNFKRLLTSGERFTTSHYNKYWHYSFISTSFYGREVTWGQSVVELCLTAKNVITQEINRKCRLWRAMRGFALPYLVTSDLYDKSLLCICEWLEGQYMFLHKIVSSQHRHR